MCEKSPVTLTKTEKLPLTLLLPMKGSIVDGSFDVSLWCFAPTIGPNGYFDNDLIVLDFDFLFVGFVVPASQGILPLINGKVRARLVANTIHCWILMEVLWALV